MMNLLLVYAARAIRMNERSQMFPTCPHLPYVYWSVTKDKALKVSDYFQMRTIESKSSDGSSLNM